MIDKNKIEKMMDLRMQKEDLKRDLSRLKMQIYYIEKDCDHIGIVLNSNSSHLRKCLMCQKNLSNSEAEKLKAQNKLVDGSVYLAYSEGNCEEIYETIQTIFLGLTKINKGSSDLEIIENLNKVLQDDIRDSYQEENGLQKELGIKKRG